MACWNCFVAEEEEKVGCWKFSLTVELAKDLPNVRKLKILQKTRAYAKIDIGSDETKIKRRTDTDTHNGLNPIWNHSINYEIADPSVRSYGMAVTIRLYTKRTMGDRYIGMFHTTMKELFEEPSVLPDGCTRLSVDIKTRNGETKGIYIGEVRTTMKYLFDEAAASNNKVIKVGILWSYHCQSYLLAKKTQVMSVSLGFLAVLVSQKFLIKRRAIS